MRTSSLICFSLLLAACGGPRTFPDGGGAGMDGGGRDANVPACSTAGPENTAAACGDGCDNEADTFVDCDDRDCCPVRSDCPSDTYCGNQPDAGPPVDGGTPMMCAGDRMPEDNLAACSDGCSNDDDGSFDGGGARIFVDCFDFDCCDPADPARADCPATTPCGMRLMRDGGPPRDGGAPMMCAGERMAEDNLAACSDGCSNDDDGMFPDGTARVFVDCYDFDCCSGADPARTDCPATTPCGRPRTDAGPSMACPGAEVPEDTAAACSDACSNDGDRFVDCEDRDCCDVRTDCAAGTFCGDM